MKIRSDFVSNSSSTIFVVIGTANKVKYNFNYQDVLLPSENGERTFGWQNDRYESIWAKINFCAIQLIDLRDLEETFKTDHPKYCGSPEDYKYHGSFKRFYNLFKDVCANELHLDIELRTDNDDYSYWIDHQSSVIENKNMEMFADDDALTNFLLSDDSYIQCGNDNGNYNDN